MKDIRSYPKIFTAGSMYIPDLFKGEVIVEEKVDGCIALGNRVLSSDLNYVIVDNLKIGDRLIGFDENLNNPKLKESVVTVARIIEKQYHNVKTSKRTISVSSDHPFLIRNIKTKKNGLSKYWKQAKDLEKGDKIVSIGTWEKEDGYDAGWLAGMFDGEGTLVKSKKLGQNTKRLAFYQKDGAELNLVAKMLREKGFKINKSIRQRENTKWKPSGCINIIGGLQEILKFLGTIQPKRLINDSKKLWYECPLNSIGDEEVVGSEHRGITRVMGLSTSTKTYIAEGLFSHNSQFKFGVNEDKEIVMASKGAKIDTYNPPKMFKRAVDYVTDVTPTLLSFDKEIYFYGEFLDGPSHNMLKYDRVPKNHIVLFGMSFGDRVESDRGALQAHADKLGLEVVPLLFQGVIENPTQVEEFMKTISYLGGATIEGVVVKNYNQLIFVGNSPWPSFGKYVREDFKEQLKDGWSKEHTSGGKLNTYILSFRTEPRWHKAIQHLSEKNEIEFEARDIGKLMKEIGDDIEVEEKENIKNFLYKLYIQDVRRASIRGFPSWYKEWLLKRVFDDNEKMQ